MSEVDDEESSNQADFVEYGIDEKPPLSEAIPLGIQHVLVMIVSAVAIPMAIANGTPFPAEDYGFLAQMALFAAGVSTIVQAYPIGPIGSRLPIVMVSSATFISPMISIGNKVSVAAMYGAALVASLVEIVLGGFIDRVKGLFPPLVTGTVVMLIGLTLIPVGMQHVGGGAGAENFGAPVNIALAALVLITILVLNALFTGFIRLASILIGVIVGYIVALPLGLIDFSPVFEAAWFGMPIPLKHGIEFHPASILLLSLAYVIVLIETVGDVTGTVAAEDRDAEPEEMRGALLADGVMSAFAVLLSAFPNTSSSQNVGVVNFTGVMSRYVVAVGGVFLIILGLVPKVGELIATIPDAVLGGALFLVFGMIFSTGVRILSRNVELNRRNSTILAISIGLGMGVEMVPGTLSYLPSNIQLFLGSGLITGGMGSVILNIVLPKD